MNRYNIYHEGGDTMKLIGYLLAFVTVTIWSSTFVITKLILDYVTPIELLTLRLAIALVFLLVIYPHYNKPVSFKEEKWYVLSGVALASYFLSENNALDLTYPSNVGLLVALSPLVTAIILSIQSRQSYFTLQRSIGLTLASIGVGFVVFGTEGFKGVSPLGDFLALFAAASFSFYTIFLNATTHQNHLIQRTRKVFIYVLITLLVYSLVDGQPVALQGVPLGVYGGIAFLGIMASSIAFIFWNKALHTLGTFETNVFIYLVPVLTMVMSYLIIDEVITVLKLIGSFAIIVGLILSEKKPRQLA